MPDSIDQWLDVAIAERAEVSTPPGFELRTIARLREEQPGRSWGWAVAVTAAALAIGIFAFHDWRAAEMKVVPISERISVPAIDKIHMATRRQQVVEAREHVDRTRGVPIIAAPVTSQEQALLRVVRNGRAKQYAGLVSQAEDLSKELQPLEFKQMEIPMLGREGDK